MTSCLFLWRMRLFQRGSTLKGKNLLLGEQILFFNSCPPMRWEAKMKMEELLPLKVYLFTLTNKFAMKYSATTTIG